MRNGGKGAPVHCAGGKGLDKKTLEFVSGRDRLWLLCMLVFVLLKFGQQPYLILTDKK
jgi:hypothetical protein